MTRRLRWMVGAALLALLVAGAAAGLRVRAHLLQPYRGYAGAEQFVEIPPGARVDEIARSLVDAGVVRDYWSFRYAIWRRDSARRLQAGEYRFDRPSTALEVAEKLERGEVHLRPITFPEGLTLGEMAALFERRGFGQADAFLEAAGQADLVAALDPGASDLEGYLFPDTYALPRDTPAVRLVRLMVDRFEAALDDPLRREAAEGGLSVRAVVTLASLIEKETARADELALVSAVYTNRLRRGMPLQCDPTVIYALARAGLYDGNLTRENLTYDSPYNTYRYPGLPPGPIAAPGRAALEAALRPAAVDYLYFVSRNDGSHAFARTLAEHNRNVREHQIRYFRERRRREGPTVPPT